MEGDGRCAAEGGHKVGRHNIVSLDAERKHSLRGDHRHDVDAATAQYALHTLEQLRREYDLASPDEQEAIDSLIERGAQIVFNSDLPEAYVTVEQWTQIRPHKWGIGDWSDAIREIFIEDDHVSVGAFAGACHFNGPIAYETFYPLNPTDAQLAEARDKAERHTKKAAALLASAATFNSHTADANM